MMIATLKDDVVINVYDYESMQEAQDLFEKGAFPPADGIVELKDGFWIGDSYKDGVWSKDHATEELPDPDLAETEEGAV